MPGAFNGHSLPDSISRHDYYTHLPSNGYHFASPKIRNVSLRVFLSEPKLTENPVAFISWLFQSKQVKAYAYVLPAGAEEIRDDINHSFVCANRTDGFYVDIDNDCQVSWWIRKLRKKMGLNQVNGGLNGLVNYIFRITKRSALSYVC